MASRALRPQRASSLDSTPAPAPAYVFEWDDDLSANERRYLDTADELRAEIDAVESSRSSSSSSSSSLWRRLFVVHGLPEDYITVLRASLDIDPGFLEAHAGRRRYRPLPNRRRKGDVAFAHYEYPELVSGYGAAALSRFGGLTASRPDMVDFLNDPIIRSISEDGDTAAVFCHASLWSTARADVLFVDRTLWRDRASPLRKARRRTLLTTKSDQLRPGSDHDEGWNPWDVKPAEEDEIENLEDVLQKILENAAENVHDRLPDVLAELAYEHWLELFEMLAPHQLPAVHDGGSLYWHITQSLEQNLDVARYLAQSQQTAVAYPDWDVLLKRTQRRVELLSTLGPKHAIPKKSRKFSGPRKFSRESTAVESRRGPRRMSGGEENQRGLDRVSYIGGILLPFSIVSGILSMNEDFEPGGSLFWVFWAVSVPIAVLTILVIYADIIRKAEVWVEVAADGVTHMLAAAPMSATIPISIGEDKPPRSSQENGRIGDGEFQSRILPHAVTYSAGDEVIIDIQADNHEEAVEEVEEGLDDNSEEPTMIVETPSGDGKPRAWRREQLGWYGACKAILGFKRPRDAADIPIGRPAHDRRRRRQARTY